MYYGSTFVTCSFVHNTRVPNQCSETMAFVWAECRKSETMLYIEGKFWFDDFKRFFSGFTFYDSLEACIDIFLSNIVPHFFLVIFSDR